MKEWWYQDGGVKNGPVTQATLNEMLAQGRLASDTAVWTASMAGWGPIGAQQEFAGAIEDPMANPWRRWLARLFDLWWQAPLVFLALGSVLRLAWPAFVRWIDTPFAGKLFGLLCIPVALLLDAALHAIAGNTPGKAMLGVRVRRGDGCPLTFVQLVRRNLGMWIGGLGFGIPLIGLFTMGRQYGRLRKGLQASYDGDSFLVRAQPIGWARRSGFGLVFMLVLLVIIPTSDRTGSGTAAATEAAPSLTWTNPVTGRSADVSPQWNHVRHTDEHGMVMHRFTERREKAMVIISSEVSRAPSVAQLAEKMGKELAADWQLRHDSLENFRGRASWTVTGEQNGGKLRMQARIVQTGNTFWFVMATQAAPMESTDGLVEELSGKLWDTVLSGQGPD